MTEPDTARLERAGLGQLHATYRKQVDAWIRPVEGRWRFVDNTGRGHWMNHEQGAALHEAAHHRVDELFSGMDGSSWKLVITAFVLSEAALWILGQFSAAGGLPGIVYVLPLALYFFKDTIAEIEYDFAMNRLRADMARQLGGSRPSDAAGAFLFELSASNLLLAGGAALLVTAGLASQVVAGQTVLLKTLVCAGLALVGGLLLKLSGR